MDFYNSADRWGVKQLSNDVIDALILNAEMRFITCGYMATSVGSIAYACSSLPITCEILRFFAHEAAWLWTSECYNHPKVEQMLPASSLLAIAKATPSMHDRHYAGKS